MQNLYKSCRAIDKTLLRRSFVGVLALSWYPSGKADDEGKAAEKLVPKILTIADQHGIKVMRNFFALIMPNFR